MSALLEIECSFRRLPLARRAGILTLAGLAGAMAGSALALFAFLLVGAI